METFEIELPGGKKFEVQAPDIQTAAKQAQAFQVQQHPWNQFNQAVKSGQKPELGKEFPGAGKIPSLGEAAGDTAMLGGMLAAGPVAAAAFPGAPVLAPAIARTAVSALPGLFQGNPEQALRGAGSTAGIEALSSILGIPGFMRGVARDIGGRSPAVHQAANFPQGGGPVVFNRVVPGRGPTIMGGGGSQVTPTQVTVQPPAAGVPVRGQNPAVILQEPMSSAARPTIGQGARTGAEMLAGQDPELTTNLMAWLGLNTPNIGSKVLGGIAR